MSKNIKENVSSKYTVAVSKPVTGTARALGAPDIVLTDAGLTKFDAHGVRLALRRACAAAGMTPGLDTFSLIVERFMRRSKKPYSVEQLTAVAEYLDNTTW